MGRPKSKKRAEAKRAARRARRRGRNEKAAPKRIEVSADALHAIVERTQDALSEEDHATLLAAVETLSVLTQELEDADVTIGRLRKLLFGSTSEKKNDVLDDQQDNADPSDDLVPEPSPNDDGPTTDGQGASDETSGNESPSADEDDADSKPKGHGRNGAAAYTGAERKAFCHESLKPGTRCPKCGEGKVYRKKPSVLVRVKGVAPLSATVYELERLRCNICGTVFTARAPPDIGDQKYDETAAAMIALLRYGCGLPHNRIERLGKDLGMPMPSGTQWGIVDEAAEAVQPIWTELIRQAADGSVIHIDDTNAQVLDLDLKIREELERGETDRSGIFTTGVLSTAGDHQIAVFFTGRQHAGENLQRLLEQRNEELTPPIQMCDALNRNTATSFNTIVANCMVHARRNFVDVVDHFPEHVAHILNVMGHIYKHDDTAKQDGMTGDQRLEYHQTHSQPLMTDLEQWLQDQFDQRIVEPNSTLGSAIRYMQNHWNELTLFLRESGAPLDNNICERSLKRAIMHRKNSLFYKTERGAEVGDMFMTIIHTTELCGNNPFDYIVALQRNASAVQSSPENWMPWNYRTTLSSNG